jgi:hypothetical protein
MSTKDELSRCECCDKITPSDRLVRTKLNHSTITLSVAICRECAEVLEESAVRLRKQDWTMEQLLHQVVAP